MLVEARDDQVSEATRARNRLHADLLVLAPGYQQHATRLVGVRQLAWARRALARHPELNLVELAVDEVRRELSDIRAQCKTMGRVPGTLRVSLFWSERDLLLDRSSRVEMLARYVLMP